MEIKIPQGCENGGAFLHPSPHPCGSLSDSGTITLHERISSGKLFCNVKSPGIFLFRDGYYHNPRYHPHCKRINAYHSIRLTRVHVLTYSSFSPSAPECSLSAPSLQQRSQSVTPYSCQVPEARVSFIALQNKFFQIISQSFSFFKGIFQKNRVFSIFHSYFVCLSTYLFSVLEYTIRCSLYRL